MRGALGKRGGNDLYTYWYAGLHIRQGNDPYRAFLDNTPPSLPIRFLDGVATDRSDVVRSDLQPAPGLTFPLIFLLTPFSMLSFNTARLAWFILLILLNLSIPALLLRAILEKTHLPKLEYLVILGLTMGMSSTRYATISGQPSIMVIALMLIAWIQARERPYLAGLFLGFALSKYSLALGFWIYFAVVERRPKVSLTALGVQAAGVIGLTWLGSLSIPQVLDGYIQLFLHHAPMEGIQLTSLLPGIDAYSPPLAIALSLLVGIPLALILSRTKLETEMIQARPILRTTFLTVLTFWSMLVAYHRAYDLQVFILMLGLVMLLRNAEMEPAVDKRTLTLTTIYTGIGILVLSFPAGSTLRQWLPAQLGPLLIRVILRTSTWVVLTGLGLTITLLSRLTSHGDRSPSK